MANITFADDEAAHGSWVVAGWAFRQIIDDVIAQFPADAELASCLQEHREFKYLFVNHLPPELGSRMTRAFNEVSEGIVAGRIRSGILDFPNTPESNEDYYQGLRELLEAIEFAAKYPDKNLS